MTNKEAVDILKATFSDTCYSQLREAIDKAIEVLEEEILPKKPIEDKKSNKRTMFMCPQCGSMIAYKIGERFVLNTFLKNNICSCGQEIDW